MGWTGDAVDIVARAVPGRSARQRGRAGERSAVPDRDLSQIELAKIDSYERKNDNRTTVLSRISALRRAEPWPGYDELTVTEIQAVLGESDEQHAKSVAAYERAHKNRAGVLRSAERETANA